MFEETEDRGQVGIGTLIVFIAMVLVAAIAAGVLVNTAGFLQEQSQQTGQDATNEVSDGVRVLSTVGIQDQDADSGTPEIDQVEVTIKKRPGSGAVDLDSTTFRYVAGSNKYTPDGADLSVSPSVLDEDSDRATITLDIQANAAVLTEGDTATLTIVTPAGAKTTVAIDVPTLAGSSDGEAFFL
jgi:flagellin-like protein